MARRIGTPILILTLAATISFESQAQTSSRDSSPSGGGEYRNKLSTVREAGAVERAQQVRAISILRSLVDKSERYDDVRLRVRTQARAAAALWNVEQGLARDLFFRVWKTADQVDRDDEQSAQEMLKTALGGAGEGLTIVSPTNSLRSEVLQLAASRDAALAELFLAKLEEAKEDESSADARTKGLSEYFDPTEPKLAVAKRLEVALQILSSGDVAKAKLLAAPALTYTTSQGIIFLCALRRQEPDAADKLYLKMLSYAANDRSVDAVAVSLLSSYTFTPSLLVTATRRGRVSNQFGERSENYEPSPELRSAFFPVAASILLRPVPPSYEDRTLAGRAGAYFTIARLLPLFQRYATAYVPALNAQLSVLSSDAPEAFKTGQDSMLHLGLQSDGPNLNTVQSILDQVSNAAGNAERDTIYVKAIRAGAPTGDSRIRQLAEKISDDKLREMARGFVDLAMVRVAINRKRPEEALLIIRDGHLTPLHRIWAMTKLSGLFEKSDRTQAIQLLENAAADANAIVMGDPNRVFALACVSASFLRFDRFRSWSLATEVTKAANAVPGFTDDNARLSARLRTKSTIAMINSEEPSFTLVNLFTLLSPDDLDLAISVADTLKGEASSSAVNLAIARSILDRQKTSTFSVRK